MLIEEFQVYKGIASNLASLEAWHDGNIRRHAENRKEFARVSDSPQQSYGFFVKKSKHEKLDELGKLDHILSADIAIGNELLSLIYQVIVHHEIPLLKALKKARFDKTVYEFSQSRIQELEKELLLWQTVNLPDEVPAEDVGHEAGGKVEKHDFRFTELPRMREEKQ